MRFLTFSLFLTFSCFYSFSQVGIAGRVVDAHTGEPIVGVHIFISQSEVGDYTNEKGEYKLENLKRSTFSLVFSHVGYTTQIFEVAHLSAMERIDVELEEDVRQLEEVYVEGKGDRKWGRYLKRFMELFLGNNHDDDLISIENDYLIDFTDLKGRDFSIDNKPLLKISNNYLGYEIDYQLESFKASEGSSYLGYSNFQKLNDSTMTEFWRMNREKAYKGSLRHFFESLINNELGVNGFAATLYRVEANRFSKVEPEMLNDAKEPVTVKATETNSVNVEIKSVDGEYYEIVFNRLMGVVYFDELDGFGKPQTSEIRLIEPLEVYPNGIIRNPEAIVTYGFLANMGVYELLPFEYQIGN